MQDKIRNVKKLICNYDNKNPLNILLWGESGCGKSTLVQLLQKEIPNKKFINVNDRLLQFNSKAKREGKKFEDSLHETKASIRMNYLRIFSEIGSCGQFVFVMDEADAELNSAYGKDNYLTGKKEINELLETLKVPVIWITNHKETIDKSACRRFQYSIQFESLSYSQR